MRNILIYNFNGDIIHDPAKPNPDDGYSHEAMIKYYIFSVAIDYLGGYEKAYEEIDYNDINCNEDDVTYEKIEIQEILYWFKNEYRDMNDMLDKINPYGDHGVVTELGYCISDAVNRRIKRLIDLIP